MTPRGRGCIGRRLDCLPTSVRAMLFLFVLTVATFETASCMLFQTRRSSTTSCMGEQLSQAVTQMNDSRYLEQVLYPNIAIPRVSGTRGNSYVAQFIKAKMQDLGWTVEEDNFVGMIPNGTVLPFSNIIATQNPGKRRRFVIACHYDSKYFRDNPNFIGATDSAVPCSIMIDTATKLKEWSPEKDILANTDTSLQYIFFDGEEAFERWTSTDSLYGSRHLAEKWDRDNKLWRIRSFMLLDLIGGRDLQFRPNFPQTNHLYKKMQSIETCLRNNRLLEPVRYWMFYYPWGRTAPIQDDHIPFQQRNVPILHLISYPFPHQWHKTTDTVDQLHKPTIENFGRVLRLFLMTLTF